MKYILILSIILTGCATTKMYEQTLDSNNRVTNGVLKAAHDEDIQPELTKFCDGKYRITGQKVRTEKEGMFWVYYWNYKYVDFRCEK